MSDSTETDKYEAAIGGRMVPIMKKDSSTPQKIERGARPSRMPLRHPAKPPDTGSNQQSDSSESTSSPSDQGKSGDKKK